VVTIFNNLILFPGYGIIFCIKRPINLMVTLLIALQKK